MGRRWIAMVAVLVMAVTAGVAVPQRSEAADVGFGVTWSGVVRDTAGAPVPNVQLILTCTGASGYAASDSSGAFTLRSKRSGTCTTGVRYLPGGSGLAPTKSTAQIAEGASWTQDIVLEAAGFLEIVTGPTFELVHPATLSVVDATTGEEVRREEHLGPTTLVSVPPGSYLVSVNSPWHRQTWYPNHVRPADAVPIVVTAGTTARAELDLDPGLSVKTRSPRLAISRWSGELLALNLDTFQVKRSLPRDDEGLPWTIQGLEPGRYVFAHSDLDTVMVGGAPTWLEETPVVVDGPGVILQLGTGATMPPVPFGHPLVGQFSLPPGFTDTSGFATTLPDSVDWGTGHGVTDIDFVGLTAGNHTLVVDPNDVRLGPVRATVSVPGPPVTVPIPLAGVVTGRADSTDPVFVTVVDALGYRRHAEVTDGRFTVGGLAAGPATVTVTSPTSVPGPPLSVTVQSGQTHDVGTVPLSPGGDLDVQIDVSFAAGENLLVQVLRPGGEIARETYLSSSDPLTVSGLAAGQYSVRVTGRNHRTVTSPEVSLLTAGTTEVALRAERLTPTEFGVIEGRILAEGRPVPGYALQIVPTWSSSIRHQTSTDDEGRYRVGNLEPGEYDVVATGCVGERNTWMCTEQTRRRVVVPESGRLSAQDVELSRSRWTQLGRLSVTGTATPGTVVSVDIGQWAPTPQQVDVQWFREGQALPGATGRTYSVTEADRGRILTVLAQVRRAGHPAVTLSTTVPVPYRDVPPGSSFVDEIQWAGDNGVTRGYPDGTFRPTQPINRGAVAAMLTRAEVPTGWSGGPCNPDPWIVSSDPPFPDVPGEHPFCEDIAWIKHAGYTTGYADGTYKPSDTLTRQAVAAFLSRAWGGNPPAPCTTAPFTDIPASHPFCAEIAWLKAEGVVGGYLDGTFRPGAPVTRQAFVAFLHRHYGVSE